MRNLIFLAGIACVAIAGCSSVPTVGEPAATVEADPGAELLARIGQFTLNDLNVAMDLTGDADHDGKIDPGVENGDMLADSCYFFLASKVSQASNPSSHPITVAGVVSGFQSARNIRRRVGGFDGFSDEFYAGCGGLIADVRGDVLKLVAKVGAGPGAGLLPF